MTNGKQLQDVSNSIDEFYKVRFISKTQKLLDSKSDEEHIFLDAFLTFQNGSAVWRQDISIIDPTKPKSSTNPLMKPEITIQSANHSYNLFREYYLNSWFFKKDVYKNGIQDLEKYCD